MEGGGGGGEGGVVHASVASVLPFPSPHMVIVCRAHTQPGPVALEQAVIGPRLFLRSVYICLQSLVNQATCSET